MMGLHLMLSNASVVIMVFRLILGCLVCRLVGNDLNVRGPMLHCEVEERSWLLVLAFLMVRRGLWILFWLTRTARKNFQLLHKLRKYNRYKTKK